MPSNPAQRLDARAHAVTFLLSLQVDDALKAGIDVVLTFLLLMLVDDSLNAGSDVVLTFLLLLQVDDALKAGTDVVLRIDVQGAATVKRLMPEAITIFVTAESERSLVTRLAERKTEDLEKLKLRCVLMHTATCAQLPCRKKGYPRGVKKGVINAQGSASVKRLMPEAITYFGGSLERAQQPRHVLGSA